MAVSSDQEEANQPLVSNEKGEGKEEEKEEDVEALAEPPDWLPDGWIMDVYRANDGTINRYYTSPISGYTFTMKSEVLDYLFSGTDERILEAKDCGAEIKFQREHEWLPKGWMMEVRAGGKEMDKMYKFYVHSQNGMRLVSKEHVLLYINEGKIFNCDTKGQCDTSSEENILAKVDFHPSGLPKGWVRELVFRKTKEGTIRRDPYYTDPVKSYTFRTLRSALSYLQSGKVSKRAFIQKTSVHDLYSFDKSADLHESLRSRLTNNETLSSRARGTSQIKRDTNNSTEDGDSSTSSDSTSESEEEINIRSMKAVGKAATCSNTLKPGN